jgi:large conductance mechanosensitive channel
MGVINEFKEFAIKGNVVDMAVGVIIGASFGKIVTSMVADVVMPPIGVIVGGVDFSKLAFTLQAASANSPEVLITYGKFIQTIVDFSIVAAVIFIVVKGINSLKKKEAVAVVKQAEPSAEEILLREIRDLLKK